ncbi:hypothetical protein V502_05691 [Pseudogymnoascus sp. VKM F-4520 (FW-2644)]|nr:hypothetical protein V502_05691 [Pseudogymnoascus sp. VKM F-4520 (FW-2644)]
MSLRVNPKFILNVFVEDYDALIWTDYGKQIVVGGRVALLDVSDTITVSDPELQGLLRAGWEQQVRDADAALLVYSITSRESFLRLTALSDAMFAIPAAGGGARGSGANVGGAPESQRARPIQISLVGNKSDLNIDREVAAREGVELAERLGCGFVETSAKTAYNVDEVFRGLVRGLVRAVDEDATEEREEPAAKHPLSLEAI